MLTRCTEPLIRFWTPFCSTKFSPQAVETNLQEGSQKLLFLPLVYNINPWAHEVQMPGRSSRHWHLSSLRHVATLHAPPQHFLYLSTFWNFLLRLFRDYSAQSFPVITFSMSFPDPPLTLHHGSSFHPRDLPQGLLWCFMGISRNSTASLFNFHVRWNEWNTNMHVWICIWVEFFFFFLVSLSERWRWMNGKILVSPWVSPKLEVRAVETARRSVSAADSAGWFFDHCPAFTIMANVTFPNHKVHLRTSLVWLAWW